MLNQNINEPFIGVVPHRLRKYKNLGDLELSKLDSTNNPLSNAKKIKDLDSNDHIIIYPSSNIWLMRTHRLKCNISLVIVEPKVVHKKYYNLINLLRYKFFRIFIRYHEIANKYNNVQATTLCDTWVLGASRAGNDSKQKLISLIASEKNKYTGHKLRHQAIKKIQQFGDIQVDILGRGYAPFTNKEDGLKPYMFSIIIENCQEVDYFTEKLVDCFLCGTLPIYWGAPNIEQYIDMKGVITFRTLDELTAILAHLSKREYYERHEALLRNQQWAKELKKISENVIDSIRLILSSP